MPNSMRRQLDTSQSYRTSPYDDIVLFVLPDDSITTLEYNGEPASNIDDVAITAVTKWADLWHEQSSVFARHALEAARGGRRERLGARLRSSERQWEMILKRLPHSETCIAFLQARQPSSGTDGEAQAYYVALSAALPGLTWTAGPDGWVESIGTDWARSRGREAHEALGDGWLSVIHPEQRATIAQKWTHSMRTGDTYNVRFQTRFADGTYRWQLARAQPIRDATGAILRWVGINIDIDDEHQALDQKRIFESLVQHTSECIAIFGVDYTLQFVNAAARRLFAIPEDAALFGIAFTDVFVVEDRSRVESEIVPELAAAGSWTGDFRLRNFQSSEAVPAQFNIFYIYDEQNTILGTALLVRDQRERRHYEQGFRMLAAAGAVLLDTLDYRSILRNLARVVVDHFAPCCVIDELDEHGIPSRIALSHIDPIRETLLLRTSASLRNVPADHIIMRTLREGEPQISMTEKAILDEYFFAGEAGDGARGQLFDSKISVPIRAIDGTVLAAITAGSSIDELGRRLNRDDLYFLQELANRATAAIENARLYERERHIALTLQEAALPRALRHLYGLQVSAEYRPGRTEATIGGDWYDTLALQDGRLLCIVGDVVGNGLRAAVAMSKLRQAMQTAALINPDPKFIFDAADQILRLHNENMYATALIAIYDPATHSTTFASAGHHGPVIIDREKHARSIACPGMIIGLRTPNIEQITVTVVHEVADVVVLYTDGIIEAERNAEAGLQQLITASSDDRVLHAQNMAAALVNAVLRGQRATDDVAVLALRVDAFTSPQGLHMFYRDVSLASEARQIFSRYLTQSTHAHSDVVSAELVFGELLGNVSRHAPGPVEIVFTWENREATLQMIDKGPGYEIVHTQLPAEFSESCRGLFLIDNFAKSLSVQTEGGRTTTCVTFEDIHFRNADVSFST